MSDLSGKIKYEGPSVEEHAMDAQKLGKTILALNSAFKKYYSKEKKWVDLNPVLRIRTNPGSYEIAAIIIALAVAAERFGVAELSKGFFGEMGKQLALRKFSKGKELTKEGNPVIEDGKMYVTVINVDGDHNKVEADTYYRLREFGNDIATIVDPVDASAIQRMKYKYPSDNDNNEEVTVSADEREYFETEDIQTQEIDLEEDFDETKAEEILPIKGKLVAYQAMATKYPFQFQPRERPDVFGRRFIPCMLENESKRDDYIELMKTAHRGYVIVRGRGVKDSSGLYRKLKIVSVEEDIDPTLF